MVERERPASRSIAGDHRWLTASGLQASVWTLNAPKPGNRDELRRLRVYLSHLHADLAALELLLSLCAGGRLKADQAGVRDYLDGACTRLLSARRHGFEQHEYLASVLSALQGPQADKIAALRALSSQITSRGLSRKVQETASLLASHAGIKVEKVELIMGDSNKANIRAGNVAGVGVGAAKIEAHDFTQVSLASREIAVALLENIALVAASLHGEIPDDEVETVEDTTTIIRQELESKKPDEERIRRRIDRLLSIATRAGAAGTALAGAVAALRAATGL